jgi:hypothetical protein
MVVNHARSIEWQVSEMDFFGDSPSDAPLVVIDADDRCACAGDLADAVLRFAKAIAKNSAIGFWYGRLAPQWIGSRVDRPSPAAAAAMQYQNIPSDPNNVKVGIRIYNARALEEIGGFDPLLPVAYDYDVMRRLERAGYENQYDDGIITMRGVHEKALTVNRSDYHRRVIEWIRHRPWQPGGHVTRPACEGGISHDA